MHCPTPEDRFFGRIGLLIEFLLTFVTPIEDMLTGLPEGWLDAADPVVRQMLGQS